MQHLCLGTQRCSCPARGTWEMLLWGSCRIVPRASWSRGNAQGGHSWVRRQPCGTCAHGKGLMCPRTSPTSLCWAQSSPTHSSGLFCVLRGWFPGRNNSSEPRGLLTGSSCYCFLKITIVGGLCSFSFFLNSILSVMLQLLKWSFP